MQKVLFIAGLLLWGCGPNLHSATWKTPIVYELKNAPPGIEHEQIIFHPDSMMWYGVEDSTFKEYNRGVWYFTGKRTLVLYTLNQPGNLYMRGDQLDSMDKTFRYISYERLKYSRRKLVTIQPWQDDSTRKVFTRIKKKHS